MLFHITAAIYLYIVTKELNIHEYISKNLIIGLATVYNIGITIKESG